MAYELWLRTVLGKNGRELFSAKLLESLPESLQNTTLNSTRKPPNSIRKPPLWALDARRGSFPQVDSVLL